MTTLVLDLKKIKKDGTKYRGFYSHSNVELIINFRQCLGLVKYQILWKMIQQELEKLVLEFKDIKFPVKVKHYHKIGKQNNIDINIFGFKDGITFPTYISKGFLKKHVGLLLIENEDKLPCGLIKNLNRFTKHHGKKNVIITCNVLVAQKYQKIAKSGCLMIIGKQVMKMPKKGSDMIEETKYYKNVNK